MIYSVKVPFLKVLFLTVALVLCMPPDLSADDEANRTDPLEMDFDANLSSPDIPRKLRETVLGNVRSNVTHLRKQNFDVRTVRDGEVIVVTIPCESLFVANSTVLRPSASALLKPFGAYLHQPQLYKVLVAAHSDNTGSEEYADELTEARAAAVDEFLTTMGGSQSLVVPYGMGMDDPLNDNRTRVNRAKNRRVEIYLIPDAPLFRKIR